MSVTVVRNGDEFRAMLADTPNACVHFAADWCEPSKQLHNMMNEWEFPKVRLVTAMAEDMEEVCEEEGVETVPYVCFYVDGKRVDSVAGAKVEDIKERITKHFDACEVINHEARMKKLINKEKVMVFIKGSPDAPRCGFSRTIVGLLNEEGLPYGHFDILTDEAIRQGLKKFSNWPTYPQLYVDGELVGGLDIVKDLKESGDLKDTLEGN
eukprot:TRINITY_DN32076_c0_g1_i1.p1 TRINITY_DN32076_c0_g1~~TRINITY_DN32076_c0_g1_i1.p1  ORF type:complete len:228 (+),score=127.62 TRINITY_DN32076_c0_g1_i1:55-684(+)